MDFSDHFGKELDAVLNENSPVSVLDKLLGESPIQASDLLTIMVSLEKKWEEFKTHNVRLAVIIDPQISSMHGEMITTHEFEKDISLILQKGKAKSITHYISSEGHICKTVNNDSNISFDELAVQSKMQGNVTFFLGIKGVDVLVRGVPYKTQNHLESYKDLVKYSTQLPIEQYQKLLNDFFYENIQYDINKTIFLRKEKSAVEWHEKIDKHPKLLPIKPEEIFHKELEKYLRGKCQDIVLSEVKNRHDERYDIWVGTSDNNVFVFEVKWLGISITPSGNVNYKYNTEDRAVEGAYQIKDYIDHSNNYLHGLSQSRIHLGVLVLFDAREVMEEIKYPQDFNKYPNIDLSQHFMIDKEKITASTVYKKRKTEKRRVTK